MGSGSQLAEHGMSGERVMTDNGPGYQCHASKQAITKLGLKHIETKPYTPRTNGSLARNPPTSHVSQGTRQSG